MRWCAGAGPRTVGRVKKVVINAGGGVDIPDVDAFLREAADRGEKPYIDLGGGMVVPFADHIGEVREAAEAAADD